MTATQIKNNTSCYPFLNAPKECQTMSPNNAFDPLNQPSMEDVEELLVLPTRIHTAGFSTMRYKSTEKSY